mmetsp:Transcript_79939/g.248057  ORF Transcript_79939/g.248057 Transcript_79939/m.248057 type:complete len:348 (+) Transcript_79939:177-1220(+)
MGLEEVVLLGQVLFVCKLCLLGLAAPRARLGRLSLLLPNRCPVCLNAGSSILHEGGVVRLRLLLALRQLLLSDLCILDDLRQQLEHSAGPGRLLVVLGRRRRRRHCGTWLLALQAPSGRLPEAVEGLQTSKSLVQNADGGALVCHRRLEHPVLRLSLLTGLLQAHLHVLDVGLEACNLCRERLNGVGQSLVLLRQVLLQVFALLDGILHLVDLPGAELELGALLLLLLLELREHLVHGLLHLAEGVESHTHGEGGQCPTAVTARHLRDASRRALHCLVLRRGAARRGDLDEAHRLRVEIAGIVRGEDPQGLAQCADLLGAHGHALLVLAVLSLARLTHVANEVLVGR